MLAESERKKIQSVDSCGPRTADYLELIGIKTLVELAHADPYDLQRRINAALGRPHINAAGIKAFENLILAAQDEIREA
jgi:nucleotidyltransferase/DNA polymerase involved in DNA repair